MRRLIRLAATITCRVALLASVSAYLFSLFRIAIFNCCNFYVILNTAGVYVTFNPSYVFATSSVYANSLMRSKAGEENDERLFKDTMLGEWGYAFGVCCHPDSLLGFGARYATLIVASAIANLAVWKCSRRTHVRQISARSTKSPTRDGA